MKQGQVTRDAHMKWYEPQHALLSDSYFTHSWGSMYALSGRAAKLLTLLPAQALRRFENEDVTIGYESLTPSQSENEVATAVTGEC